MSHTTSNFHFAIPDKSDKFSLQKFVADNWNKVESNLMPVKRVNKNTYENSQNDSNCMYLVLDESGNLQLAVGERYIQAENQRFVAKKCYLTKQDFTMTGYYNVVALSNGNKSIDYNTTDTNYRVVPPLNLTPGTYSVGGVQGFYSVLAKSGSNNYTRLSENTGMYSGSFTIEEDALLYLTIASASVYDKAILVDGDTLPDKPISKGDFALDTSPKLESVKALETQVTQNTLSIKSLQALSESVLIGSTEIIVDTDTKKVSKSIESGTPDRPKEIVMSLRIHEIGQHKYNSIDEVVLPNIRFYKLHYKGSYYAILESDENLPKGTYYVDWVMTLNK